MCSGPWDAPWGRGSMASPDLQEDPGLGTATSLAPALPPLPFVVLLSSGLALSSQHLQGMSGTLAQCQFADLHGLGCSPLQQPRFSLQRMATPAAVLAGIASLCVCSRGPSVLQGLPGFARGLPCAHPPSSLWEVQSQLRRLGLCHLPNTPDLLFWP